MWGVRVSTCGTSSTGHALLCDMQRRKHPGPHSVLETLPLLHNLPPTAFSFSQKGPSPLRWPVRKGPEGHSGRDSRLP